MSTRKLFLPAKRQVDKRPHTRIEDLTTALEEERFFVFPVNGVMLYEGTSPPYGWVEDTALTAPDPAYIYIRISQ